MTRRSESPRLSVLLSVYNEGPYLDAAIRSIRGQSFSDFELLILDDGSTDESPSIIAHHAADDPRVVAQRQPNKGLVASLNLLLSQARAPLIARMDGDDFAYPDRFSRQLAFLEHQPDVILLGTQIDRIDARGRSLPDKEPHPTTHDDIVASFGRRICFAHSTVVMNTAAARAVGGYRAAFRHCEDLDLWLRLARVGKIANLPDQLLGYRIHAQQISQRYQLDQALHAAIAIELARLVDAGAPDPFDALQTMPALDSLETRLGIAGLAARVRASVANSILWAPDTLTGEGLLIVERHIAEMDRGTLAFQPLARAILRLVQAGRVGAAVRLARPLLRKYVA